MEGTWWLEAPDPGGEGPSAAPAPAPSCCLPRQEAIQLPVLSRRRACQPLAARPEPAVCVCVCVCARTRVRTCLLITLECLFRPPLWKCRSLQWLGEGGSGQPAAHTPYRGHGRLGGSLTAPAQEKPTGWALSAPLSLVRFRALLLSPAFQRVAFLSQRQGQVSHCTSQIRSFM